LIAAHEALDDTAAVYQLWQPHDTAAVDKLWQQLAELGRDNLDIQAQVFDQQIQKEQYPAARQTLDQMGRLEGEGGVFTPYCEAVLLLAEKGVDDNAAVEEAQRLLAKVAALRPSWPRIPRLQGQLFDKQKQPDKALEKYQRALELGDGTAPVVRRVVQLLVQRGRVVEATALLKKQPESLINTPELGRIAAELVLVAPEEGSEDSKKEARKQAFERAQKQVKESKDHRDFLWLGRMAALAGQTDEAEKAYRRARDLAPTAPETWTSLILLLARSDATKAEKARAEEELAQAQKQLIGDEAAPKLALCQEALGHNDQAEKLYLAALARRTNDANLLQMLATFYARTGQPARMEPVLSRLIEHDTGAPETTVGWARRTLAINLATRGGYRGFQDALKLLEKVADDQDGSGEDRYARGIVLATQPAHRAEAIQLLEAASAAKSVPAGNKSNTTLLLLQLYEQEGNWPQARALLQSLVAENRKNPVYVSRYIRVLLKSKMFQEAQTWLEAMPKQDPKSPSAEYVELHARVLEKLGKKDEALRQVRNYAEDPNAQPVVAALLYEQLGQPKKAEPLYRKYYDTHVPGSTFALAAYLCRQKDRIAEALELHEKAWKQEPPEAAVRVSLALLGVKKLSAEQRLAVVDAIRSGVKKKPDSLYLQLCLAQAYEQCDQIPQAEGVYRQILEKEPNNTLALNNLAYRLATQGESLEEAQARIEKAIENAGPQAELLDTQAWVHLQAGRAEDAIKDLDKAIAQGAAPMFQLHLAMAYQRTGDTKRAVKEYDKAVEEYDKAVDAGPKAAQRSLAEIVPASEQAAFAQLKKELGK
jgi:tetratricopeptide (TPR) repeat protein